MTHRKFALSFVLLATVCAMAEEPASKPAAVKVPEGMAGDWFEGTISPTNYYDSQTGKHLGNARQMGSILKIHADGKYEKYTYIYMRTYNVETEIWNTTKGNLSFKKNRIALTPTTGRYKVGGSSPKPERDMTEKELENNKGVYPWVFEKDKDSGRTYMVFSFEDGSSYRYRRLDEEDKKK